jgi:hypothetical protein
MPVSKCERMKIMCLRRDQKKKTEASNVKYIFVYDIQKELWKHGEKGVPYSESKKLNCAGKTGWQWTNCNAH